MKDVHDTPESTSRLANRLTWSVSEAANLLGISKLSAYEGVRTGSIPSIRIGRRVLIPCAALEKLLSGVAA